MLISIVVTVRNEQKNIGDLLDSLVNQEQPIEIIVVDAFSKDRTRYIVREYFGKYDFAKLCIRGGTRGGSRNFGVSRSKGDAVAFIDGDCIANPFWIEHLREGLRESKIVAGKAISMGYRPFEELERVELIYKGFDITYPSSNLLYDKKVFQELGGFDEWFVTAEDIDLNLRAVQAGYKIHYEPKAIVYHRTRSSFYDFYRQAVWNGAGRKQLTLKHGHLWHNYRPIEMFRRKANVWSLSRLAAAMLGYFGYKFFGKPRM